MSNIVGDPPCGLAERRFRSCVAGAELHVIFRMWRLVVGFGVGVRGMWRNRCFSIPGFGSILSSLITWH